jgi:hypothetical protein
MRVVEVGGSRPVAMGTQTPQALETSSCRGGAESARHYPAHHSPQARPTLGGQAPFLQGSAEWQKKTPLQGLNTIPAGFAIYNL